MLQKLRTRKSIFAFASNCIISIEPRNKHGKFGKEGSKGLNAQKFHSEIIDASSSFGVPFSRHRK